MNRNQAIALAFAAANVVFIMLFPPFDTYSIANTKIPVFAGFDFYFNRGQYMIVNTSMLYLELFVVLINVGIAWLLLGAGKSAVPRRRVGLQNATLILVALNLVVIVLFPPFESVHAMTKAAIPTFEGFYFAFARHSDHVIVSAVLYLEVLFVLINGALLWLIFRDKENPALTAEEAVNLVSELRNRNR